MKSKTLERYVRYGNLPYPEIIERALKGGWKILEDWTGYHENFKTITRQVIIVNDKNETYETCYAINEPEAALYNVYGFDR